MRNEVGSLVEGTIVDIVKFGAFVRIRGGKTGLIHISQISDEFVREVADHVEVGERIIAKIISIDDRDRVQLSIKKVTREEIQAFSDGAAEREKKEGARLRSGDGERRSAPRGEDNFEAKMKGFLRQSEDRLVDVRRNLESKRGGGRRRRK